ncbi:unnamed protein product, partial [Ixodes pacificus]
CGASQSAGAAPWPEGSVTRGRRTPRLPHVRGISGAEPFAARLRRPQDGEKQGMGLERGCVEKHPARRICSGRPGNEIPVWPPNPRSYTRPAAQKKGASPPRVWPYANSRCRL